MGKYSVINSSVPTYSTNNRVEIIHGGKVYFDLVAKLIDQAEDTIHLQYYIFDEDFTGKRIIQHLEKANQRGVKIFILADGYASQKIPKPTIDRLNKAGLHFRFFEALVKSKYFYFGRRMHHKLFVVDTQKALVGGLNISDKYNDLPGKPAWLDFAILVEGEVVKELCILCWKSWNAFQLNKNPTPCEQIKLKPDIPIHLRSQVGMRRNDWVRRKNQISNTYYQMFKTAHHEITILSSYFLPGTSIRKLMEKASKRGIKIRVISAGVSDVLVVKYAERWLYDWILRNKIELYEYQKNILHGKLGICDQEWFTIGSYNINDLSAYASIELNLEVNNPMLAKELYLMMESIIEKDCVQITLPNYKKTRNVWIKLMHWMAYKLCRIVFYLFTFYFTQKK